MKSNIVVVNQFFTPGSKSYNYYASGGFNNYMKNGVKEGVEINSTTMYHNYTDYMNREEAMNGHWTNTKNGMWNKVSNNSNVWSVVISFDAEYTKNNGIASSEQTKTIIDDCLGTYFLNNNFDPNLIQYAAAHHANTDHHHVHIIFSEIGDEKKRIRGKIKIKSNQALIALMESKIANRSFNWSLLSEQRTDIRKAIAIEMKNNNLVIANVTAEVRKILKSKHKRRVSYGSLSPILKTKIDHVFNSFIINNKVLNGLYKRLDSTFDEQLEKMANNHEQISILRDTFQTRRDEIDKNLKNQLIKMSIENGQTFLHKKNVSTFSKLKFNVDSEHNGRQKSKIKKHYKPLLNFNNFMKSNFIRANNELDQVIEDSRSRIEELEEYET